MIYVNNEPLKEGTTQWDRYKDFLDNVLPTLKNPVVFKSTDLVSYNSEGLPEPVRRKVLPLETTVGGYNGSETWIYTERPPIRKKDNIIYSGKSKTLQRKWQFDKNRDKELIFMILEILPYIDKGVLTLVDDQRAAAEKLASGNLELDTRFMIQSSHSPISRDSTGSEEMMRLVASAWGVPRAFDQERSYEEIVIDLWDMVQRGQKTSNQQRGFKAFLKEVEADDAIKLKGTIQRAVEKEVIIYDKDTFSWRFVINNYPIMTVPAGFVSDPQLALYNFLLKNTKSRNSLYRMAGVEADPEEGEVEPRKIPTLGDKVLTDKEKARSSLSVLHISLIRSLCKELEIKSYGLKKLEMVDKIMELFEERKELILKHAQV